MFMLTAEMVKQNFGWSQRLNHGIWLLTGENELFMSYQEFPWFKNVVVGKILNVEEITPGHFYWPDLDVDLDTESIEHPERFPLKAKYRILSG